MVVLLILALAFPPAVPRLPEAHSDAPVLGPIAGRSWLAYDDTYGYEVDSYQPERRAPMASTTKLMTALLVAEHARPADEVTISRRSAATGHKQIGLREGESWTVGELLEAVMVVSANDAAVALAEHVGGDVDSFVAMMNGRAGDLGLSDTAYVNPHGLDADGQYTSARDLLTLARHVMATPVLARLAARPESTLAGEGGSSSRWRSTNELLGFFDGAIGVKTGWTTRAGDVLVAAAERDGRRMYAVVMGSTNANADAAALLEYSFAVFGSTERRLLPLTEDRQEAKLVRTVLSRESVARVAHLLGLWKRELPEW